MARDSTYPLVPIINFLGFVLVLIPFSTRTLQKWNTGVCMYAIYVSSMCLFVTVDTIIWSNNIDIISPVWCDIMTRVAVASLVGIPACSLVITRRLCKITKRRTLTTSKKSKRNELIFDLSVTVGFPVIITVLYYIIQGARFVVVEQLGCSPIQLDSGLTILLNNIWPIILPLVSIFFYSFRTLWFFYHQRKEVNKFLDSNQTLDRTDYYRIMALGCLDALILLPIGIYTIVIDVLQGRPLVFWTGWTYVHTDWGPYGLPSSVWEASIWNQLGVRWDEVIDPALALIFFLIFGLTREAHRKYWIVLTYPLRPLKVRPREDHPSYLPEIVFRSTNSGAIGVVSMRTEHSSSFPQTADGATSNTDPQVTDQSIAEKGESKAAFLDIAPGPKKNEEQNESDTSTSLKGLMT